MALAFAALAIALVFPGVLGGREFLWGDFVTWYFPAHDYAAERWRAGALPLWNPYTDGGMPFAGEADHGSFYPPSLLLHGLTGDRWSLFYGLELFALAHMGLAIAATYGLLRGLGCGAPAALFGGLAYGLGSVFVARAAQVSLVCAQAWTPLVLGAARNAFAGRRPLRSVVVAGASLGLLTLAGSPSTLGVTAVGLAALVAAEALVAPGAAARRAARGLAVVAGVAALGLAIGAVQLLPTLELLRESERAAYTLADLAEYAVSPASLVMLLVPRFHGALLYDQPSYWGPANFVELSGYVGLLPLFLAPLAFRRARREAWPWMILALIGLLLALGPHGGLQEIFYRFVPVIGELRTPGRYLQIWALGVAVVAGLGLDAALRTGSAWQRGYVKGALVLVLGLAVLLAALAPALAGWLEAWKQPLFQQAIRASLISCAAAALALLLLLLRPGGGVAALVCLLALTGDLAAQGGGIGVIGERGLVEALWAPDPVVDAIRHDTGRVRDRFGGPAPLMLARVESDSGPGRHLLRYQRYQQRIFSLHSRLLDLLNVRHVVQARSGALDVAGPSLVAPEALWMHHGESHGLVVDPRVRTRGLVIVSTTNSAGRTRGDTVAALELTSSDGERRTLPIRLGIETGDFVGDLGGTPVDVAHVVDMVDAGARLRRHYVARLAFEPLDLARVQVSHAGGPSAWVLKELYLVTDEAAAGGFVPVARIRGARGVHRHVFRNDGALPRAFLAPAYRLVDSVDEALDAVSGDAFDPRAEVVIEREGSVAPDPPRPAASPGAARVESYAPEEVVVAAHAPEPGAWVVLADVDFPGWTAEVDGAPAPIARADALFRAVWLRPGPHRVVFRYAPRSFVRGAWLTLAGAVACAGLALAAPACGGATAKAAA